MFDILCHCTAGLHTILNDKDTRQWHISDSENVEYSTLLLLLISSVSPHMAKTDDKLIGIFDVFQ